jgi:hypothetical protein
MFVDKEQQLDVEFYQAICLQKSNNLSFNTKKAPTKICQGCYTDFG